MEIAAIAVGIAEAGVVAAETQEVREAIQALIIDTTEAYTVEVNVTFRDLIERPPGNILDNFKRSSPETAQGRLARLQELRDSNNVKGKIGEKLSEARDSAFGTIETQVRVGDNVVDHVTTLDHNVSYTNLSVRNGEMSVESDLIPKGARVATEVKNGDFKYLQSELTKGHLQKQIKAGLNIADYSIVEINADCAAQMIEQHVRAAEVIKQLEDAGGALVLGLPSYDYQLDIFINVTNKVV